MVKYHKLQTFTANCSITFVAQIVEAAVAKKVALMAGFIAQKMVGSFWEDCIDFPSTKKRKKKKNNNNKHHQVKATMGPF